MPVRERKWREGKEVRQGGKTSNWLWLRSRLCRDERQVREAGRQVRWFLDAGFKTRLYFGRFGRALDNIKEQLPGHIQAGERGEKTKV